MSKHSIKFVILLSLIAFMSVIKCELLVNQSSHISSDINSDLNKQSKKFSSDLQEFKELARNYIQDILTRDTINILPGIAFEKKSINSTTKEQRERSARGTASLISQLRQFTNEHVLTVNLARASTETGRLFFFKGKYLVQKNIFNATPLSRCGVT